MHKFLNIVGKTIQYVCITYCTFELLGEFVMCTGPSMEPTICSGDILLTEHLSPRWQWVKKGDIIISKCPFNSKEYICKRVIGLPGDRIRHGFSVHVVPNGHIWVEGDNNNNSEDSRVYGPIPQGLLRGRAFCKVWPLNDIRIFSQKSVQQY